MKRALHVISMTPPRIPKCLTKKYSLGRGGLDQSLLTGGYGESETPQPTISRSQAGPSLAQYAPAQHYHPQLKPPSPTPVWTSALLVPCATGPGFRLSRGFNSRNQVASFLLTRSHHNIFLTSERLAVLFWFWLILFVF